MIASIIRFQLGLCSENRNADCQCYIILWRFTVTLKCKTYMITFSIIIFNDAYYIYVLGSLWSTEQPSLTMINREENIQLNRTLEMEKKLQKSKKMIRRRSSQDSLKMSLKVPKTISGLYFIELSYLAHCSSLSFQYFQFIFIYCRRLIFYWLIYEKI